MYPHPLRMALCALIAILLVSGCAASGKRPGTLVVTSDSFDIFNGEYEVLPALREHAPRSIAVLPFTGNATMWKSVPEAYTPTDLVRRGLYNHVSSLPFTDQEMHETDRLLQNAGLTPEAAQHLLSTNPGELRGILGVDAVLSGEVTAFDRVFIGIFSQVAVGCDVRLTDLHSGELLWQARHISREFGGGLSITPVGLAISALSSAWNIREEQFDRKTDDLFREIVSTLEAHLPDAMMKRAPAIPGLDLFTLASPARYYRAGSEVRFRLVGDAGADAYADLPGYKTGIRLTPLPPELRDAVHVQALAALRERMSAAGTPLTEVQEADVLRALQTREVYEGAITVNLGDTTRPILPRGYIISPPGGIASTFATTTIQVDGKPPMSPLSLNVTPLDRAVALEWRPSPSPDTVQYDIFMARGDAVEFTHIRSTGDRTATIGELDNFTPVRFRVVAVDAAGNQSQPGKTRRAVPVPEKALIGAELAPQQLGGTITSSLRLTADRSPYTIISPLTITEGGSLFIEQGVTVLFRAGTGIRVDNGTLRSAGTTTAPVLLQGTAQDAALGSGGIWDGITARNHADVRLTHTDITHATTGLDATQSHPMLDHVRIRNAARAALLIRRNAQVTIICSEITAARGLGGIMLEGSAAELRMRDTTLRDNHPFDIQNLSPMAQDAAANYWPASPRVLGNVNTAPALPAPPVCP